jgi:hypothetical protein
MKKNKELTDIEIIKEEKNSLVKKAEVTAINVADLLAEKSTEIKSLEDVSTAMMQTAQEYTLAVEEVLANEFDFSDDNLKMFEKHMKVLLMTLGQFEAKGFNILSINDMKNVGEIARGKYKKLATQSAKKALPLTTKEFKKFLGEEKPKKEKKK